LFVIGSWNCNPPTIKTEFLEIETLSGEPFKVSSLQGKPVFLNVWATWCRPCIEEFPFIDNLKKTFEKEGWKFVIVSDEKSEKIKSFETKTSFSFDYYKMKNRMQDFGITEIPQTYIINAKGEVVKSYTGANKWDSEQMMNELRDLIK